ncbi:MAG: hypothetical protein AVDCRST_MAG73-1596 [uncultured Thermomicrobiales bacterium]|uniref:Xylose isomerase-like TIM barrel domain-containing protein n=1 Tax=uncultured Thermomicrobiales bacterium TaxID=1645740 RepID=A0A6J4U1L5_9BACT|nr:MAG: hypothetical protein AVDCRST_MAG73-1596 [uncultured Thermomicrobiales bacterium]
MWTLTGFADEIDPDLEIQLRTLAEEGIGHLELRGVWDKNVLDLSDDEVGRVAGAIAAAGVRVSAIGSPIGKIGIGEPFGPHRARFGRALDVAQRLEAPFVRIFSFFVPEGDDPARHREAVLDRLGHLVRAAEGSGVTLLHENEKGIYGDTPARCHDLLSTIGSPTLRAAWDPANFVQVGVRPHDEGYALLRPFVAYLHVKDAARATGEVVTAGAGDGQVRETVTALHASGFAGFCSLEPHLQSAGPFSGFSGPALFRAAAAAFKDVLREQGIGWE